MLEAARVNAAKVRVVVAVRRLGLGCAATVPHQP